MVNNKLSHLWLEFEILNELKKNAIILEKIKINSINIKKIYICFIDFSMKKYKKETINFIKDYKDRDKYQKYFNSDGSEEVSDTVIYMNSEEYLNILYFLGKYIESLNFFIGKDWSEQLIKDGIKSILEQDEEGIKLYNELKNINIKALHERYYEEVMNEIKELS